MKLTRRESALSILNQCPPEKRDELYAKYPWLKKAEARKQIKRPGRNNQPEQALQIAAVKLLRSLPGTLCFAVPNHLHLGGKSTGAKMGYMARQKSAGLLSGVSDLVIIFRNSHGATTIVLPELKSETGQLSDNQQLFADTANALGCYTGVTRSLDDLTSLLQAAGHPSFSR